MGRLFFRHCLVVTPSAPLSLWIPAIHARLGSVLTCTADTRAVKCFTEFTRFCRGAFMSEKPTRRTRSDAGVGGRPYRRNGQTFTCPHCGDEFYRKASFIKRGITKTCGKRECISVSMSKENNPFWGKEHSEEVLSKLREAKTATPRKKTGPPKGYKHTPEARAKMSEALRLRWATNRDAMLSKFQTPPKPREEQRYRKNFTPWQRKNWKSDKCLWCEATEDLVLDHVVAVVDGGLNIKENAQTLCRTCNIWKAVYIDRPVFLARLALQGG